MKEGKAGHLKLGWPKTSTPAPHLICLKLHDYHNIIKLYGNDHMIPQVEYLSPLRRVSLFSQILVTLISHKSQSER